MRRSKRKCVVYSSAALVAGLMLSEPVLADVNPIVLIGNEVNGGVGSGSATYGMPWDNDTPNWPNSAAGNGPATNNIGWSTPGGGNTSHNFFSMSGAIGTASVPAPGATEGVSSMRVTTPGVNGMGPGGTNYDSTGDILGAQYETNAGHGLHAFASSNLIEADVTLLTAPTYVADGSTSNDSLGVYFRMNWRSFDDGNVDASGGVSGYRTTTNRSQSYVTFASNSVANGGGETGTKTMIWNYGMLAGVDDSYLGATGLCDDGTGFYFRIDLDSTSQNPITYYVDNIRFASRAVTYLGTGGNTFVPGGNVTGTNTNWSGLDTDANNSYFAPASSQDQNTHGLLADHLVLNDCLHFGLPGAHTVVNNIGTFTPDAASRTNAQFGGIVFDSTAGPFILNSDGAIRSDTGTANNTIDMAGDIINNSTSLQTFGSSTSSAAMNVRMMSAINITAAAGGITFINAVTSFNRANTGTLQNSQFGPTINGPGVVKFMGNDTYQGATTVNSGVLEFGGLTSYNGASTTTSPGTILLVINPTGASGVDTGSLATTFLTKIANAYSATLIVGGNTPWLTLPATQGDAGTGALALATADAAKDIDFTGTVGGSSANLSATGLSALSIGALPVGVTYTGNITPATTGNFANTYRLGGGGVLTVQSALTGAGNKAEITNLGTVILNGTNTYGGNTAVDAGSTLTIGATGSIISPNISVATGATMNVTAGGSILSGTNLTDNGTVNFNASRTLGSLNGPAGSSVNLAGPAALTVNGGGTFAGNITGTGSLVVGGSTLELDGSANSYNGNTTVNSGATLNVGNATLTGSLPSTTVLTSNGTTRFAANPGAGILSRTVAGITLSTGGKVIVSGPTGGTHTNRTLLTTSNLTFGGATNGWQGSLELTGNDLLIHGGNLGNVTNQLKQGRAGNWTGANGIASAAAAADTRFLTTLGSRAGAAGPTGVTLDGVNTTASDVLVKYTYYGDADLSGTVDGADYALIDTGFGNTALTGWVNGDFNYDGVVNGTDYSLIDNTFNQIHATGASPLAIVASSSLFTSPAATSAVPEPTAFGLLGIGAAGLMARRRTKKNIVCGR